MPPKKASPSGAPLSPAPLSDPTALTPSASSPKEAENPADVLVRNQHMRLVTRAADGIRVWQWNSDGDGDPLLELPEAVLEPSPIRPVAFATSVPMFSAVQSDCIAIVAFPPGLQGTARPFVKVALPFPPLPIDRPPVPHIDISPKGNFLVLTFVFNRVGAADVDHPNTFVYNISALASATSSKLLPLRVRPAPSPHSDPAVVTPEDAPARPLTLPVSELVPITAFDDISVPLVSAARVSAPRLFEWDGNETFIIFRTSSGLCCHRAVNALDARNAFLAKKGDKLLTDPASCGSQWTVASAPPPVDPALAAMFSAVPPANVAWGDLGGLVTLCDTLQPTASIPLARGLVRFAVSKTARPRIAIYAPAGDGAAPSTPASPTEPSPQASTKEGKAAAAAAAAAAAGAAGGPASFKGRLIVTTLDQLGTSTQLDECIPEAEDVNIQWAPGGSAAIVLASCRDRTETNYRGITTAYALKATSVAGASGMTMLPLDATWPVPSQADLDLRSLQHSIGVSESVTGSVHGIAWSHDGKKLAAIHGAMPDPTVSIFTPSGQIQRIVTKGPFNMLSFSPNSQFLFISGTEGLSHTWRTYDMSKLILDNTGIPTVKNASILAESERAGTVTSKWAPDGRSIVLATTAPRLNVGNGFVLLQHNGAALMKKSFTVRHAVVRFSFQVYL